MRKKIIIGFVFTTLILLITPIVSSINEPIIKEQKIDMEKLKDITMENIVEFSDKDHINTMMSRIKNISLDRRKYPCICTLLLLIFSPFYIKYKIWNKIGITPPIAYIIAFYTSVIAYDYFDCNWIDWLGD